ncbi:hypothetical protein [Azospirillum argentinense]|uniref:cellulase family glycosylhydrolase n=1 Tax=Azospirillum argentinense TaxID=2970906 RepID=UPI0032DE6DF2
MTISKMIGDGRWPSQDPNAGTGFAADRDWANTVALIQPTAGNPVINDLSQTSAAKKIVAHNRPVLNHAVRRHGVASLEFTAANKQHLTVEPAADFAFGYDDFTIHGWLHFKSVAARQFVFSSLPGGGAYGLRLDETTRTLGVVFADRAPLEARTRVEAGRWLHVAVTRHGRTLRLFLNGRVEATLSAQLRLDAGRFLVGSYDGRENFLDAFLDGFQIIRGRALWTRNFAHKGWPDAPDDVPTIPARDGEARVQFNYRAPAGWNVAQFTADLEATDKATVALLDPAGVALGWTLAMTKGFAQLFGAGHATGTNSGRFADAVLAEGVETGATFATFTLSGLDNNKRYDLDFLGSHAATATEGVTRITVAGQSQTLRTKQNAHNFVRFAAVAPVAGAIAVRVERAPGASLGVLNALVVRTPYTVFTRKFENLFDADFAPLVADSGASPVVTGGRVELTASAAGRGLRREFAGLPVGRPFSVRGTAWADAGQTAVITLSDGATGDVLRTVVRDNALEASFEATADVPASGVVVARIALGAAGAAKAHFGQITVEHDGVSSADGDRPGSDPGNVIEPPPPAASVLVDETFASGPGVFVAENASHAVAGGALTVTPSLAWYGDNHRFDVAPGARVRVSAAMRAGSTTTQAHLVVHERQGWTALGERSTASTSFVTETIECTAPAHGQLQVGLRGAAAGQPVHFDWVRIERLTDGNTQPPAEPVPTGEFATSGSQIVDAAGKPIRLTGVNWNGAEHEGLVPGGLWVREWKGMMQQMRQLGFNCVRLPLCIDTVTSTATQLTPIDYALNPDLRTLTPLQVIEKIVDYGATIGLFFILDMHRSWAGVTGGDDGTMDGGLWFDNRYSEAQLVAAWKTVAARLKNRTNIVGADIWNEPHAGFSGQTTDQWNGLHWGQPERAVTIEGTAHTTGGAERDYAAFAERVGNAILEVAPHWLIIVEGVEFVFGAWAHAQSEWYFWGGNLAAAKPGRRPIQLSRPGKLVYSVHEYGPEFASPHWLTAPGAPGNLHTVWNDVWGWAHQQNIAPVFVGETGGFMTSQAERDWYAKLHAYMAGDFDGDGVNETTAAGKLGAHFTVWSWCPTSGDTGGILEADWTTVNGPRYNAVKAHLWAGAIVGGAGGNTPPPPPADRDGDGIPDAVDPYPDDPTNTPPDRDGDGVPDHLDPYPDDPTNTPPTVPPATVRGWMTRGNQIVDGADAPVQFTGVNVTGFAGGDAMILNGIGLRGYRQQLDQVKALGFNLVRLPFSEDTVLSTRRLTAGEVGAQSQDLVGKTPLEAMDAFLDHAGSIGLFVLLDNHRVIRDGAVIDGAPEWGMQRNGLWYETRGSAPRRTTEADKIAVWTRLAERWRGKMWIIGADIHNEPGGPATWDAWAGFCERCGDAIHAVNPDWLIVVEGVETVPGGPNGAWMNPGANLFGARTRPVRLKLANKLVYSAHPYGPELAPGYHMFQPANGFPGNLHERVWMPYWAYLYWENIAPVIVGEFGAILTDGNAAAIEYNNRLVKFMAGHRDPGSATRNLSGDAKGISWTRWEWSDYSGDTKGILESDFATPNATRYGQLQPYLNAQAIVRPLPTPAVVVPDPEPEPEPEPETPAPTTFYVAPAGSDDTPGTEAAPFATLHKAHAVAQPGDLIYARGGVHALTAPLALTRSGAASRRIKLWAYPGETPVLDGAALTAGADSGWAVRLAASGWHLKGLEIRNAKTGGLRVEGTAADNLIETLRAHGCDDGAGGGTGVALTGSGAGNRLLNVDSHTNRGDGFAITGAAVVTGCRAWGNGNDGFITAGGAELAHCWAWKNGFLASGAASTGTGYGVRAGGAATVRHCLAWDNRADGFTDGSPAGGASAAVSVLNNTAWRNGARGFRLDFGTADHTVRNNLSLANANVTPAVRGAASHNSWQLEQSGVIALSSADFASVNPTVAQGPRGADGALPATDFLTLAGDSDLVDKGTDVGLPFNGTAPDLGARERAGSGPVTPGPVTPDPGPAPVYSPAYYVDPTAGNDANGGTSPATAWRSLAKVNATAVPGGGAVLFKRGGSWTGDLTVAAGGTAGARVTYGAYGEAAAARPIINGRCNFAGRSWTTVRDLTIRNSGGAGVTMGATGQTLLGCAVTGHQGNGVQISGTASQTTIKGCLIDDNGDYGVVHFARNNTQQLIDDNTISNNGRVSGLGSGWNGYIQSGDICNNRIFNNGINGQNGKCHGLYVGNNQANSQLRIFNNEIHSNPNGAGILAKSSATIFNNLIHGNDNAGISLGQNETTAVTYTITDNVIRNNGSNGVLCHLPEAAIALTLESNTVYQNAGSQLNVAAALASLRVLDNVFWGASTVNVQQTAGSATINHNLHWNGGAAISYRYGTSQSSFAAWQAAGRDANGLTANPLFSNAGAGDFQLQTASPARNRASDGAHVGAKPVVATAPATPAPSDPAPGTGTGGGFRTSGTQILDGAGKPVRFTGVNWAGMEWSNGRFNQPDFNGYAPNGCSSRHFTAIMDLVKALGFNLIRLPLTDDFVESTHTRYYEWVEYQNPEFRGKRPLEVLDLIVNYARQIGLYVLLDHHRSLSHTGAGTQPGDHLADGVTEARMTANWQTLARRYLANPAVIGADIHNEPNGAEASWAHWAAAAERMANAIHAVNPNWLTVIEGVEIDGTGVSDSWYWWGGNLAGVRSRPIAITRKDKLVYSVHDYGPNLHGFNASVKSWHHDPAFPANMPAVWDAYWGFIVRNKTAPVFVGEFGAKMAYNTDLAWVRRFHQYMNGAANGAGGNLPLAAGDLGVSWTMWALGPPSGDTDGILLDGYAQTAAVRYNEYRDHLWKGTITPPKLVDLDGNVLNP